MMGFFMKTSLLKAPRSLLWGMLLLFLAVARCAGPGEPPAQEHVRRLVEVAWEKMPPAAYTFSPPCSKAGSGPPVSQTAFAITNVQVAESPSYGRPVLDAGGPRVFYWPVTVEVQVRCSRTAAPEGSKSLLSLPDSRDSFTVLEGVWIAKKSYIGNLVKNEDNTWKVQWPQ